METDREYLRTRSRPLTSTPRFAAALRLTAVVSALLVAASTVHPTVATSIQPPPSVGSDAPAGPTLWGALPSERQDEIVAQVLERLHERSPGFEEDWTNSTGMAMEHFPAVVASVHDKAVMALSKATDPSEAEAILFSVAYSVASELGLAVPDLDEHGMACSSGGITVGGVYDGAGIPGYCLVGLLVIGPVLLVTMLVVVVVLIVAVAIATLATAIATAAAAQAMLIALTVIDLILLQVDHDNNRVGDEFQQRFNTIQLGDLDNDTLGLVQEFRWSLVPICLPTYKNCLDHESDPATGLGGDNWNDGDEWLYWNNPANDVLLDTSGGVAVTDSDRNLDSDGDTLSNVDDVDSDNDGILDGDEIPLGTYPEFADSDCLANATACTPSSSSYYYDASREGQPGKGDGLNDSAERDAWDALGAGKSLADFDGDGINNNLLDPDADGDGLLDGTEFLLGKGQVRADRKDTERDGLADGSEVAWNEDTDLDGLVNANDLDSDGDGMPDKWEMGHHFNMVDPTDAILDRDGDQLNNLGEYLSATDPDDMDSEDDLLLDGEEVNAHHTNPHHWDTDQDAMPDRYEAQHGLNPLDANDATQDFDLDSFDRNSDGVAELFWPNLAEYRYGRAAVYDESVQGPWLLGTSASIADTDRDTAKDGYEVYYGTEPRIPAELEADDDQDGLNWTLEVAYGTDPDDPDTDHDGLCDGGRAANCRFPGLGSTGFQPGEVDYSSTPYATDSDDDGIPDPIEAQLWDPGASGSGADVDGDQYGGLIDSDSDGDGLEDGHEQTVQGTDLKLSDTDADGLSDGDEVNSHGTNPLAPDMDGDTLTDGAEVTRENSSPFLPDTDGDTLRDDAEVARGTNPASPDTDGDGLPDAWEVAMTTNPTFNDAALDADGDALTNAQEHSLGTRPLASDSDADGLPDGYENTHDLQATVADGGGDLDFDGLSNLAEYSAATLPGNPDTDTDGASDGWEANTAKSDPLTLDTDADGLNDGPEKAAWDTISATAWSIDHDGDTLNGVRDVDSDNDGLSDRDEFQATMTRADRQDTDGDTVSDFDEVVTWGGQYDPNDPDTDGDGVNDAEEIRLLDANADDDQDGLRNGDEDSYGTDRSKADTDCDGISDGPEHEYWGSWDELLVADVDGDSLLDGIEIGTTGTPPQAFYRTLPDVADSDDDELNDDEEANNGVHVACDQGTQSFASSPFAGALDAVDSSVLTALVASEWIDPATQLRFGHDANGWYIQGGYGVRLYVDATLPGAPSFTDLLDAVRPSAMSGPAPGANGYTTSPSEPDTDKDGLKDGQEVYAYGTDPMRCDTDNDGLGDALEVGFAGSTRSVNDPCTHRDRDPATRTNPGKMDSDGDGLADGKPIGARGSVTWEDANANGRADLGPLVLDYCANSGEPSPSDGDTDDDGVSDFQELASEESGFKTQTYCFDSDRDGLSDGLEQGVASPVSGTNTNRYVLGGRVRTWQPFQGGFLGYSGNNVLLADSDQDGLVDGLEDVNRNGVYGEWSSLIGAYELSPNDADYDDDGLSDGRELRVWSKTFPEVVGRPSWSFQELRFGSTFNPFETDPRNANTDGDDTEDGYDINPRADAVLQVALERTSSNKAFKTLEESDPCCTDTGRNSPDLVFYMELQMLGLTTILETNEITNLYSKDWVPPLPWGLAMNNPAWGLNPTTPTTGGKNAAPTLEFDIPENVGELSTSPSAATITLLIRGRDNDNGPDDMLDFKKGTDSGPDLWEDREIRQVFNILKDAGSGIKPGQPDPWMGLGDYYQWQATDRADDRDRDVKAALWLHLFDNAPRQFVEQAIAPKSSEAPLPPAGNVCYGTPTCR